MKQASNTLLGYLFTSFDRIQTSPHQDKISIAVLLLGLVCAWDGPLFYSALFTIIAAVIAASLADYEVQASELTVDSASQAVVLIQVGAATALATHFGFDGSQVLFGVVIGLCGVYGCGWAPSTDQALQGFGLFFYSNGAILGCLIFTVWRHLFLKTLTPLVGGFLVATGLGALLSRAYMAAAGVQLAILPLSHLDWASSADFLLGTRGHGGMLGASICALVALLFMIFGGRRKRVLAVSILLVCILVNAVTGAIEANSAAESWQWPIFGCFLWAGVTAASAWRQLADDAEIREQFDNAMGSMKSVASMTPVASMTASIMRSMRGRPAGGLPFARDKEDKERLIAAEPPPPPPLCTTREARPSRPAEAAQDRKLRMEGRGGR